MTEDLLRFLAGRGEMPMQELLEQVARPRGDYIDFYPVAALLQAKYISTDSASIRRGERVEGQVGHTMHDTAVFLCQLTLPVGQSFEINGCARDSASTMPVKVFITSDGYLRLDELEQRRVERRRKRNDYAVSFLIAVCAALLSSYLAHHYAQERARAEKAQVKSTASEASVTPQSLPKLSPRPLPSAQEPLPDKGLQRP